MSFTHVALVTGACGGIGRACARRLASSHALFLTDIDAARLDTLAAGFVEDGYVVAGTAAGDLALPGAAGEIVAAARAAGPIRAVLHAAGLSPALAEWDRLFAANLIGTEHLLTALEAALEPGLVAILLASMAAHLAPADPALDALMANPLAPDLLEQAAPLVAAHARSGMPFEPAAAAYGLSKRGVMRLAEARAIGWGKQGARIVTISPGTIWTPMGRKEVDSNPGAAIVRDMTPAGWGRPSDIAEAAAFLCSDAARFVTGCDLRIDGGATPLLRSMMG